MTTSALLTLAQLREAMPGADLEAELASGRVRAIGLRCGRQCESVPRETWAHYCVCDDFDGCALFINPHDDPLTGKAASRAIALAKLSGHEDRLRPELRGEGSPAFWTALRFEIAELQLPEMKTRKKKAASTLLIIEEALRQNPACNPTLPEKVLMPLVMEAVKPLPVSSSTLKRARRNVLGGRAK